MKKRFISLFSAIAMTAVQAIPAVYAEDEGLNMQSSEIGSIIFSDNFNGYENTVTHLTSPEQIGQVLVDGTETARNSYNEIPGITLYTTMRSDDSSYFKSQPKDNDSSDKYIETTVSRFSNSSRGAYIGFDELNAESGKDIVLSFDMKETNGGGTAYDESFSIGGTIVNLENAKLNDGNWHKYKVVVTTSGTSVYVDENETAVVTGSDTSADDITFNGLVNGVAAEDAQKTTSHPLGYITFGIDNLVIYTSADGAASTPPAAEDNSTTPEPEETEAPAADIEVSAKIDADNTFFDDADSLITLTSASTTSVAPTTFPIEVWDSDVYSVVHTSNKDNAYGYAKIDFSKVTEGKSHIILKYDLRVGADGRLKTVINDGTLGVTATGMDSLFSQGIIRSNTTVAVVTDDWVTTTVDINLAAGTGTYTVVKSSDGTEVASGKFTTDLKKITALSLLSWSPNTSYIDNIEVQAGGIMEETPKVTAEPAAETEGSYIDLRPETAATIGDFALAEESEYAILNHSNAKLVQATADITAYNEKAKNNAVYAAYDIYVERDSSFTLIPRGDNGYAAGPTLQFAADSNGAVTVSAITSSSSSSTVNETLAAGTWYRVLVEMPQTSSGTDKINYTVYRINANDQTKVSEVAAQLTGLSPRGLTTKFVTTLETRVVGKAYIDNGIIYYAPTSTAINGEKSIKLGIDEELTTDTDIVLNVDYTGFDTGICSIGVEIPIDESLLPSEGDKLTAVIGEGFNGTLIGYNKRTHKIAMGGASVEGFSNEEKHIATVTVHLAEKLNEDLILKPDVIKIIDPNNITYTLNNEDPNLAIKTNAVTVKASPTPEPTPEPTATPTATPTPTVKPTITPIPEPPVTATPTVMPTLLPPTPTVKPTATPSPTPTPTIKPTATPIPTNGTLDGITWTYSNGVLNISGSGEIRDFGDEKIQWQLLADKVTSIVMTGEIKSIGANAFADFTKLKTITLPQSLNQINSNAFANCTSLNSIKLPEGMTGGIGGGAFKNCTSLQSINVPKNVMAIGEGAFEGCTGLSSITLPFIGSQVGSKNNNDTFCYIFKGSVPSKLTTVEITNETNIPENAFAGLDKIENIKVNSNIGTIGNGAFDGCKALKEFTIPEKVTSIGDSTFRGCESAVNISVPNTVKSIGEAAFDGCKSLREINIPNGIEYLADNTFRNCESLTAIEIPNTVESIGVGVLEGCKRIVDMKIPFIGANSDPQANGGTSGYLGYIYGAASNADVPPALTKIEVTSTNKSNYIPKNAFKDCGNIVDIIIDGGRSIDDYAFVNCKNLKNVYIPRSVDMIGNNILEGCTRLVTLTVPFIGSNRLDNNTEKSVLGGFFGISENREPGSVIQYYKYNLNSDNESKCYKIPASLKNVSVLNQTTIPTGAFMNCYALEKAAIVSGATMNPYAFYNCTALKLVSLPNDLQTIGEMAFAECENLETINIPTKVKNIGSQAFYNARNLKNVTMPDSITSIADDVFNGTNIASGDAELLANNKLVITCTEDSEAYKYAAAHGIKTNIVSSQELDIRKASTTVTLLSTNAYLFDVTDTYNMRGVLHIELYDGNNNKIKEETREAKDVEYRVEFTEDDMKNFSYARVYVTDESGMAVSTEDELITKDGGEIPEIPESDIEIKYNSTDKTVSLSGQSNIKSGTVLIEAIYKDDRLVSIKKYDVRGRNEVIEVSGESGAKYMLWESLASMKQLAKSVTAN